MVTDRSVNGANESPDERVRNGVIAGLAAYLMWGVLPVYFKLVDDVASLEVLAHRIIWAVPFGALIIAWRRQWPEVRAALRHRRTFAFLSLSAVLIAANWLVYIYAVQNEQIFQASLGYYINPLIFALVGVCFLGETLGRMQVYAVILAAAGVAFLTFSGGELPAIALFLGTSFTIYGVIRKQVVVGGMPGLFIETLVLLPLSIGYMFWLIQSGGAAFTAGDPAMVGILIIAGPLTVMPLLCFALAARRLNLSTVGMMQFLAPTLQFLIGVAYGEKLTTAHIICFTCIWVAVTLFVFDAWRGTKRPSPLTKSL